MDYTYPFGSRPLPLLVEAIQLRHPHLCMHLDSPDINCSILLLIQNALCLVHHIVHRAILACVLIVAIGDTARSDHNKVLKGLEGPQQYQVPTISRITLQVFGTGPILTTPYWKTSPVWEKYHTHMLSAVLGI